MTGRINEKKLKKAIDKSMKQIMKKTGEKVGRALKEDKELNAAAGEKMLKITGKTTENDDYTNRPTTFYTCVCQKCGHRFTMEGPKKWLACPECGMKPCDERGKLVD